MLLAFHRKGIGAAWINFVDYEVMKENLKKLIKRFNLPKYYKPISLIGVGYPYKIPKNTLARRDTLDIIFRDDDLA